MGLYVRPAVAIRGSGASFDRLRMTLWSGALSPISHPASDYRVSVSVERVAARTAASENGNGVRPNFVQLSARSA